MSPTQYLECFAYNNLTIWQFNNNNDKLELHTGLKWTEMEI